MCDFMVVFIVLRGLSGRYLCCGYYSRATRLRDSAILVMNHLDGIIPPEAEKIKKLPGCGPYTASAISSIGFNLPAPLVDGNVSRLLSRLFFIGPIQRKQVQKFGNGPNYSFKT